MDRSEFETLNPIQQEMFLVVARFYCVQHGCLESGKARTATFEELLDVNCEYIDDVASWEYQNLLDDLQQAAFYVVQEETLYD